MLSLVDNKGGVWPLGEYERPKRVVKTVNILLKGKKTEAVVTKGERYTYLTVDGVDMWIEGQLEEGGKYSVKEVKEQAAA
jgi:hypothetical protein